MKTGKIYRVSWISAGFLAGMLFFCGGAAVYAETVLSEYQVKALFLLKFVKYVDWPVEAMPSATSPIVIGILGQDMISDPLRRAARGKNINGRDIVIRNLSAGEDLSACTVLFVSSSENSRMGEILGKIDSVPVLTVGENESFLQKGGIINFTLKDGKINLAISLKAAQKVKLQISSKLLSVAETVR